MHVVRSGGKGSGVGLGLEGAVGPAAGVADFGVVRLVLAGKGGEGVAGDGVGSVVGVAPLEGVVGERRWWEPVRFAAVGRYPEVLRVGRQWNNLVETMPE